MSSTDEPVVIPTPNEQRDIIVALDEAWQQDSQGQDKVGDIYYVIDQKWLASWKKYVQFPLTLMEQRQMQEDAKDEGESGEEVKTVWGEGESVDDPGKIDNEALVETTGKKPRINLTAVEGQDYELVREDVWEKLKEWYGCNHELKRQVIAQGDNTVVEVHLLRLYVVRCTEMGTKSDKASDKVLLVQSRRQKILPCLKAIAKRFGTTSSKSRFWVEREGADPERVDEDAEYLEDIGLEQEGTLLCEIMTKRGQWPRERNEKAKEDSLMAGNGFETDLLRSSATGLNTSKLNGRVGLSNLGNTCFMNSSLQCLSNTEKLTNYFLLNHYADELNKTNLLGMGGQVALAYADLIKQMWGSKNKVVTPSKFKKVIGKFAPQFTGYNQQDSQELLAFLLDGIHEDLNRVTGDKPYVEPQEAGDLDDETAANEAWERHLMRNKSIVVDLFQAQLKSRIECPECDKVSVTFDPFLFLSLPLPVQNDRRVEVIFVRRERNAHGFVSQAPTKLGIEISNTAKIRELREKVAELIGVSVDRITLCDVFSHKVVREREGEGVGGSKRE
eukprot:TRINITY_DN1312_c0_g1_i4.p1 TRINITY_DN1312_c0_g1~~TRINITY_DN1312_c0_g1_i4.p1  ORF type:complete len:558 (-),score=200.50 TRINITY_DN1312_c0_g1_i4:20-1693(-)